MTIGWQGQNQWEGEAKQRAPEGMVTKMILVGLVHFLEFDANAPLAGYASSANGKAWFFFLFSFIKLACFNLESCQETTGDALD